MPDSPIETQLAPLGLRRDGVTVALYSNFVVWGWLLYSFSPSVPLLAAEQGINKAQAGLHGTAMAVGTLLSAVVSAWLVERLGRRGTLLLAVGVLAAGVVGLVSGGSLTTTLPGALVTAIGGTLVLSAGTTALSVHHGEAAAAAVTEANGVGALFGMFAPLTVGASVAVGWGWRPAVAITVALAAVAAVLVGRQPGRGALGTSRGPVAMAATDAAPSADLRQGFSRTFSFFWIGLVAVVAIENATIFWAADLLISRTGAGPGIATGALTGLVAGMCAARFVVGPIALRRAPEKLLILAFALAGVGWFILWSATTTPVALVGLVIAGFGYGAHYPLSISLVLRASQGQPDRAQARATLGAGGAIAIAPFLLGALADRFGTHGAFLLLPVLIAIGAGAVALGLHSVHHPRPGPRSPSRESPP